METSPTFFLLSTFSLLLLTFTHQQQIQYPPPPLNSAESNSVYLALESINPDTPWRSLYPDDLCLSAPHGIVCSYFTSGNDTVLIPHVTELNFGFVSDDSPNPTCSSRATFPDSLSSLPHLRKLFFYRCFLHSPVSLTFGSGFGVGFELEELVLMENSALSGSVSGIFGNLMSLRRFILTGSNVSGGIPEEITKLPLLEQLTISGNEKLSGGIPVNLGGLSKLRVLDLSNNGLSGVVPESLGQIGNLIKLDLSYNNLIGKIPENMKNLRNLEFVDLGYNKFGNYGIPLFLGEMGKLKEVYLSGNLLGGVIPEFWENLGGVLGIGLSNVGLVGNIPSSMGVFLSNVSYIGLDNNKLEGEVPKEFGLLQNVNEVNLRNNRLSGQIPFSAPVIARVGSKIKVEGNLGLCLDESMGLSVEKIGSSLRNLKTCNSTRGNYSSALMMHASSSSSCPIVSWCLMFIVGVFWSFYHGLFR